MQITVHTVLFLLVIPREDTLILDSSTPVIHYSVAITDFVLEFSETLVAGIRFQTPMSRVTLGPNASTIYIDGLSLIYYS